jgi:hypothetical protein
MGRNIVIASTRIGILEVCAIFDVASCVTIQTQVRFEKKERVKNIKKFKRS